MLNNMEAIDDLRGLARARSRQFLTKTIRSASREDLVAQGWSIEKKTRKSARLRKAKAPDIWLRDRAWYLLYQTGFQYLSGELGAVLELDTKKPAIPVVKLNIVGIDTEAAIAIECVAGDSEELSGQLSIAIEKLTMIRQQFAAAVNQQYPESYKRQIGVVIFAPNDRVSLQDRQRMVGSSIVLLEERDLDYYGELASHLGDAAKYQLLADILPNKTIAGLSVRVPAIKSKMGPYTCYSFSISPEYLLKIAYVSHRSKGSESDVGSYQRMVKRWRLNAIKKYLDEENSLFPTNIVTNVDKTKLRFERQQQDSDQKNGVMGWLHIRPAYKSAWIIDGQHRLFAYSGHPKAAMARLSVLAFESLPPDVQANLFIDINAKQKSVKQSLLQDLYSAFHWTATKRASEKALGLDFAGNGRMRSSWCDR